MRILEVRDGFIKLEAAEKLPISSFLEIKDCDKKYIAQVIQVKKNEESCVIFAKILFLYDGSFSSYNNTLIKKDASVDIFPLDIINNYFKPENPIKVGAFAGSDVEAYIDKECFNRKMLISVDEKQSLNKILINLAKEFTRNSKILVIDMCGIIDSSAKIRASVDFKIPLNTESLEFIYEDCLKDATSDSKDLVKEIFAELAEYSKSVPFVPFKILKTIVDDMVDKSHVFKLLVLKNKLAKFDKAGYFAATLHETNTFTKNLQNKASVIDLSGLESLFQNRYLSFLYNQLSKTNYNGQVFIITSNQINKKNIKTILCSETVASSFIVNSRFKYLNDFKSLFTNYFIEPSFTNNEIFKTYKTFLNNMSKENYLLVGDSTNFIPVTIETQLATEYSPFDDVINLDEEFNNDINDSADIIVDLQDSYEEIDPQTAAIEKKSQDLVERLAEENNEEENAITNIFQDNSELNEVETSQQIVEDLDSEPSVEIITEKSEKDDIELAEGIESTASFEDESEFHTQVDPIQIIEVSEEITEMTELIDEVESPEIPLMLNEQIQNDENEISNIVDNIEINFEQDLSEEANSDNEKDNSEKIEESIDEYITTEVIPINDDISDFNEIIELSDSEFSEDDIVISMEDPEEEALNKEINEAVDKVFTTIKEEPLSDSDLDFIDELNNIEEITETTSLINEQEELIENNLITEDNSILNTENEQETLEELEELPVDSENNDVDFIEPLEEYNDINLESKNTSKEILEKKNATTPMVPVYSADIPQEDLVLSDNLEQGDTVIHAKYGTGVVEKMIKYGSKMLYSINFENIGRRLLDPTLTEIKKS